jgi:hypothetical protein
VRNCAESFIKLADNRNLAVALYWLAVCELIWVFTQDCRTADEVLGLARQLSDRQIEFLALRIRALSQVNVGHIRPGVRSAEDALAIVAELNEPVWELEVLHTTVTAYAVAGELDQALRNCQRGMDIVRRLNLPVARFEWDGLSADIYQRLGRYQEAADTLAPAIPGFRDHFMRRHHSLALLKLLTPTMPWESS